MFGPTPAAHSAVLQFLQASGFTITSTYKHRLLIAFSSTIGQVEQIFHITINNYTAPDGHTFYANVNEPQLPAAIAGALESISGLNNATRLQHSPQHMLTVAQAPFALPRVAAVHAAIRAYGAAAFSDGKALFIAGGVSADGTSPTSLSRVDLHSGATATLSGARTDGTGSARNAAHFARSAAVDQSCPAGAIAPASCRGSSRSVRCQGWRRQ